MLSSLLQPYLAREAEKPFSGEPLLFRLLHHPDFDNDPVDIARLLLHRRSMAGRKSVENVPLLPLLDNPLLLYSLGLRRAESLMETGRQLGEWIAQTRNGADSAALLLPVSGKRQPSTDPTGPVIIALPDASFYKGYLRQMALSVSTLNKFLRCRLQFYYENILKVVTSEPVYFSFGKVMHTVLEQAFLFRKEQGTWPTEAIVLERFEEAMRPLQEAMTPESFQLHLVRGMGILRRYYADVLPAAHTNVDIEYTVPRVLLENRIPITGRIDKLEYHTDGAKVVDYKTGDPESAFRKAGAPSPENPLGGDYWRQMVFYKLLVEAATGQRGLVKNGVVEFLERDARQEVRQEWVLSETDAKAVREQVRDAWKKIQGSQFDSGCGRENCEWCGLVRTTGIGLAG